MNKTLVAAAVIGLMNVVDESELMRPKNRTIAELMKEEDADYDDNYVHDPATRKKIMP